MSKVIVSCAITGAMHTPSMSEALPVTPEQIAAQSIEAAHSGAAIIHLHARKPCDGEPTGNPDVYSQFLPDIDQATDAVINLTTGGSPTMSVAERLAAAVRFEPEMCSLNMGSMNFAIFPAANRIKTWKYSWEEGYVRNSGIRGWGGAQGLFFSIPIQVLRGCPYLGIALAMITAMSSVSGLVGANAIGLLKSVTGSFGSAIILISFIYVVGGLMVMWQRRQWRFQKRPLSASEARI